jgi:hypothetical protein
MGARNYLQRKKKGLDMKGMDRFVYWAIFTVVSSLDRLAKFPRAPYGRMFPLRVLVIVFWTGLLLLTLGYNPGQTSAEEEVPVLQEVVVTATRQEEEIRKIPANVTVITEDDIENSNAKTVLDLLRV